MKNVENRVEDMASEDVLEEGILDEASLTLDEEEEKEIEAFNPNDENLNQIVGSSFSLYLRDMGRYPLLTKEEEESLFIQLKDDSLSKARKEEIRQKIITANLRFVVYIALKYRGRGESLEDMVGAGNEGLIRAVERYDVSKPCRFVAYAVYWIRQAITRSIYKNARTIALPCHISSRLAKLEFLKKKYMAEYGEEMPISLLAKESNYTETEVKEALDAAKGVTVSIHTKVKDDAETELLDMIPDEESITPEKKVEDEALKSLVSHTLESVLSEREKEVLTLRFGLNGEVPYTLEEVGKRFEISRERVRKIEQRALRKLRNPVVAKNFLGYCDKAITLPFQPLPPRTITLVNYSRC